MEKEYPTIAASDLFMGCCCIAAAVKTFPSMEVAALGFCMIAAACFFGVLRFGINAKLFAPYNETLAKIAGRVGIPCIGLGFARGLPGLAALPSEAAVLTLLIVGLGISLNWSSEKGKPGDLYTTVLASLGMLLAAYYGVSRSRWLVVFGVVLFLVAGLVVTPNRFKLIGNVRCENWFHYLSGLSYLLLAYGN